MGQLYNPSPRFIARDIFLSLDFFATFFDMWDIAMGLYDFPGRFTRVPFVSTKILFHIFWWQDNTVFKNGFQLRYVMPICSGYD
jgi:hypothetical protein